MKLKFDETSIDSFWVYLYWREITHKSKCKREISKDWLNLRWVGAAPFLLVVVMVFCFGRPPYFTPFYPPPVPSLPTFLQAPPLLPILYININSLYLLVYIIRLPKKKNLLNYYYYYINFRFHFSLLSLAAKSAWKLETDTVMPSLSQHGRPRAGALRTPKTVLFIRLHFFSKI